MLLKDTSSTHTRSLLNEILNALDSMEIQEIEVKGLVGGVAEQEGSSNS